MRIASLVSRFLAVAVVLVSTLSAAAQQYGVSHGPYLQGLDYDGVTVVFTTSQNGLSKVEVRKKGAAQSTIFDSRKDGLIMADNTHNVIHIENLEPATEYEYRIVSKRVEKFQPYKVTFGEDYTSPWYSFSTFDPAAREFKFIATNDIHEDAAKCGKLLDKHPLAEADMVFYVGDMINYFHSPEQPYKGFIDISVEKFAKHKPFAVVRGNHETRGALARTYDKYIHNTREGKYYAFYTFGSTAVIMLDSGEDKPDSHEVYAGFTAFDDYRLEQVEWLKKVVKSKEFRRARNRIVMLHIPPAVEAMKSGYDAKVIDDMLAWHGNKHWGEIVLPVLNGAGIDLMISAHQHSYHLIQPIKGANSFPILINDNKSSMYVVSNDEGVGVRVVNVDGKELLNHTF